MDSIWVFQAPIFQVLFHLLFFRLKYRGLLIISFKLIFLRAGFHERRRLHVQVDNLMDGFEQRTEKKILSVDGGERADRWTEVRPGRPASECTHVNNEFSDQLKVIATSLWLSLRLLNYSFLEYPSHDLF